LNDAILCLLAQHGQPAALCIPGEHGFAIRLPPVKERDRGRLCGDSLRGKS
jgi:hypothetical protein